MRAPRVLVVLALVVACSGSPPSVRDPHPAAGSAAVAPPPAPPPAPAKAKPVTDPALLTCKTVEQSPPPGTCGVLEKAPRAADSPAVQKVIAVWKRVEGPFRALSGRESALVVLGPDARTSDGPDGEPIPPAAYICPGAPPTVYVPHTLVTLIDDADPKKYPSDFLGFVIGHELGHRMNDLTPDGCQLAAFQRPGKGVNEEELADARSAFFITSAGFSASKIARDDLVTRFLEAEYKLGRTETQGRKDSLLGALQRFDSYEALYQTALSVALTGEMEAADRLLTWADELVQSHGVPLPELRVVRAITRINRAAPMAPWLAELGMPVGIEGLRCTPLHPGHSGLWEEPSKRVRGPDIERGRKLLKEALALLDEAEARGATPFTVAAARTCASLYLADAQAAADAQTRAESLAAKTAPTAVQAALADNRALVTFLAFARGKAAPSPDDGDALGTWADGLTAALGSNIPASLATVIAQVRDPRTRAPAAPAPASCASAPRAKPFAALPAMPATHGSCPAGFALAQVLPGLDAAKATGTTQGMTVCTGAAGELTQVRLTATTEPPLTALARTLLALAPPADLRSLAAWECQCAALERQGISDTGEVVYRAQCPALKLDNAVLVVENGAVTRVLQYSR